MLKKYQTLFLALIFASLLCGAPACGRTRADVISNDAQVAPAQVGSNVTIAAVGDIMMGTTYPNESFLPPDDGRAMLAEVAPILSAADLAFGNLEGPMIDGGVTTKCRPTSRNCHAFRVPTRYGRYLKDAGFDVMSLANNHSSDFGAAGMTSSARVLDQQDIAHAGRNNTPESVARLTINNRRVVVVAFATNNVSYNLNDVETARRVVSALAPQADILIVSFHGGAEGAANQHVPRGAERYLGEARGDLRRFTHACIDAGADLILGHGPHVLRGMEVYRNRLIAYSLGNFATYARFNLTGALGTTMILEARLSPEGEFLDGRIHPAMQTRPGGPRLDRTTRAAIPLVRDLSTTDFGASAVRVEPDGTISPPSSSPRN